jgi:hypothetical protein
MTARQKKLRQLMKQGVCRSIANRMLGKARKQKRGPKPKLQKVHQKQLEKLVDEMQEESEGRYEITARMVHQKWKAKTVSIRSVQRFLSSVYAWKPVAQRAKPPPEKFEERRAWKAKQLKRPASFWKSEFLVVIDGHEVKRMNTARCQEQFRKERVRAQWRKRKAPGGAPVAASGIHIQTKRKLLYNYGKGCHRIFCGHPRLGVIYTHPLVRDKNDERNWTEAEALRFLQALRAEMEKRIPAATPSKMIHIILDGDPVWNTEKFEQRAAELNCDLIRQPPFSPDCNLWDISLNASLDQCVLERCERSGCQRMGDKKYGELVESIAFGKAFKKKVVKAFEGYRAHLEKLDPVKCT